jgi:hypothetical protein
MSAWEAGRGGSAVARCDTPTPGAARTFPSAWMLWKPGDYFLGGCMRSADPARQVGQRQSFGETTVPDEEKRCVGSGQRLAESRVALGQVEGDSRGERRGSSVLVLTCQVKVPLCCG